MNTRSLALVTTILALPASGLAQSKPLAHHAVTATSSAARALGGRNLRLGAIGENGVVAPDMTPGDEQGVIGEKTPGDEHGVIGEKTPGDEHGVIGEKTPGDEQGAVAPDMTPSPDLRYDVSRALRDLLRTAPSKTGRLELYEKLKLLRVPSEASLSKTYEIKPSAPFAKEHTASLIVVGGISDPEGDRAIIMPPARGSEDEADLVMPPARGHEHFFLPRIVLKFKAKPKLRYLIDCRVKSSDDVKTRVSIESEMRYWGGFGDASYAFNPEHLVHVVEPVGESVEQTYVISVDALEEKERNKVALELYGCEITPAKPE